MSDNTATIVSIGEFLHYPAWEKANLDISWLKDKSLADFNNLSEPDEFSGEFIDNLDAGLSSCREIITAL